MHSPYPVDPHLEAYFARDCRFVLSHACVTKSGIDGWRIAVDPRAQNPHMYSRRSITVVYDGYSLILVRRKCCWPAAPTAQWRES